MYTKVYYATVTEALKELNKKGYTKDFNLEENLLAFKAGRFNAADFKITEAYRYEGDTDPGDESTVYAIESLSGMKGVLVTAYGSSSDTTLTELIKKLQSREK